MFNLHNIHNTTKNKGFTLVEILVYIAILTIVSAATMGLIFTLDDIILMQKANQRITQSADMVLERMLLDIRSAHTVDIPYSSLQTTPGSLTVIHGATSTMYSVSSSTVMVAVNGTSLGSLTSEYVSVDELRFFVYDNSVTELVRIVLTLSTNIGSTTVSKTFNSSAVLRSSYE